jgi:hypothetical protein
MTRQHNITDLVFKRGFDLWLEHVGRHRVSKFRLVSETKQAGRINLKKPEEEGKEEEEEEKKKEKKKEK